MKRYEVGVTKQRYSPSDDRVMMQVRIPRDLVRRIDHLSVDEECYRQEMVERLLRAGLEALGYENVAMTDAKSCSACQGYGDTVAGGKCTACDGSGRVVE